MLIKMAILFVMGLAAIGLGAPLMRLLAPTVAADARLRMGLTGLLGLFVAASIAVVVNFFAPVGLFIAALLFVLGLTFFLAVARRVDHATWAWYAGLVLLVTPIAVFSREGYDGGLYHLPHQYWLVTDKIVFGLANLHGRLGFDPITEPLLALGWLGGENLVVVPLIAGLFTLFFLVVTAETMRDATDNPVLFYFTCAVGIALPFAPHQVSYAMPHYAVALGDGGWTNTDFPSAICGLICMYCGFAAAARDDRDYLVLSYFFAGFATALKLSGAVVALFPLGLTAIWIWQLGLFGPPIARILLVSVLFLPWTARNLVVSGCLAYPVSWTCLSVPWEASRFAAEHAMKIKAWARVPMTGLDHLSGWAWIPIWLESMKPFLISWAAVAVFGIVLAMAIGRIRPERPVPLGQIVVFTVYAIVASGFWFLAAPDPRFGISHLLALALLPGLWLLATGRPALIRIPTHWMAMLLLGLPSLVAVGFLAAPDTRFAISHLLALALLPVLWLLATGRPALIRIPTHWTPMLLLAVPLVATVGFSWRYGVNEERSLFDFHAVRFARVETTTEGVVRHPIADDRCFLAPPPCSPEGANLLETKLGSYRAFIVAK
jgi:hypothetical protein